MHWTPDMQSLSQIISDTEALLQTVPKLASLTLDANYKLWIVLPVLMRNHSHMLFLNILTVYGYFFFLSFRDLTSETKGHIYKGYRGSDVQAEERETGTRLLLPCLMY